jgi:hypothetical protein
MFRIWIGILTHNEHSIVLWRKLKCPKKVLSPRRGALGWKGSEDLVQNFPLSTKQGLPRRVNRIEHEPIVKVRR